MAKFDYIFSLFGFHEDDTPEHNMEDFKDTPQFKIGMFVKLMANGFTYKSQIVNVFTKADPELDANNISDAGEFLIYNRAWYWISQCKIKSKIWKEALKGSNNDLLPPIMSCIRYFETIEEYEKCSFLKNIQDFLKENLDT